MVQPDLVQFAICQFCYRHVILFFAVGAFSFLIAYLLD